jgi:Ras-related protein Rab-6A
MEDSYQKTNTNSEIDKDDKNISENNSLNNDLKGEKDEIKDGEENIEEKTSNIEERNNKDNDNDNNNNNNKENIIDNEKKDEKCEDKTSNQEQSEDEIKYNHELIEKIGKYNIEKMPDNYDKENANYKVLFLGDPGVGKSSLVLRGTSKKYNSLYKPTVGFDLLNHIVKINDKVIKLQIWDTCGQEEFSMCNQSLFKNVTIAIMVYSIINKNSFDNIKKWVSRVKNLSKENTIFFLVGNKSDLNTQREVKFLEGKTYGIENFQFFVETSSKSEYNIDILFKEISIYLYENKLRTESYEEDESKIGEYIDASQSSIFLNSQDLGSDKKCLRCC